MQQKQQQQHRRRRLEQQPHHRDASCARQFSEVRTLLSSVALSCSCCCTAYVLIVVVICVNDAATASCGLLRTWWTWLAWGRSSSQRVINETAELLIFLAVGASIAKESVSFCSSFSTSCLAVGPSAFAFVAEFLVGELLNLTKPAMLREYA